jgi:hypothetical protein
VQKIKFVGVVVFEKKRFEAIVAFIQLFLEYDFLYLVNTIFCSKTNSKEVI